MFNVKYFLYCSMTLYTVNQNGCLDHRTEIESDFMCHCVDVYLLLYLRQYSCEPYIKHANCAQTHIYISNTIFTFLRTLCLFRFLLRIYFDKMFFILWSLTFSMFSQHIFYIFLLVLPTNINHGYKNNNFSHNWVKSFFI